MKFLKYIALLGIVGIFLAITPRVLFAQSGPIDQPGAPTKIENPIGYDNLDALLFAVAEQVAKVGFYVIVIFIIWSGFLFVKAGGNEADLKKAKDTFLW